MEAQPFNLNYMGNSRTVNILCLELISFKNTDILNLKLLSILTENCNSL